MNGHEVGGLDPAGWGRHELDALIAANGGAAGPAAAGNRWSAVAQFPASAFAAGKALDCGGTAADGFVVAALVDTVMTAGASSLGGMLDVVVREPSGDVHWLDALYRVPLGEASHDDSDWDELTTTGRSVLVPGMLRGLEKLWERFGRLDWSDLFIPARYFAERGFAAYPRLAQLVTARQVILLRDSDAAAAYLPEGRPLEPGELLQQSAMAETLAMAAGGGADAMYLGAWADALVNVTNERGGVLTTEDLHRYRAEWAEPLQISYLDDWTVHAGGPTTTASCLLRALKTCEALGLHDRPPRDESGATLFAEMQADAYAWDPPIWHQRGDAAGGDRLAQVLSAEGAERVAELIQARIPPGSNVGPPGTHSISIVDGDGLAIAGAHSISWSAWGTGVFIGGIPLNAAGYHLIDRPVTPGLPALGVHSTGVIATRQGEVLAAAGTNHHLACSLQCLNDVLGHGFALSDVLARPDGAPPPSTWQPERTRPTSTQNGGSRTVSCETPSPSASRSSDAMVSASATGPP